MKVLIYSGTTEGRRLAECLSRVQIPCIVCVATEYGRLVMPPLPGVEIREGRLQVEQMRALVQEERVCAVVDATHPYAAEVTKNIKESVKNLPQKEQIPYLRLLRDRNTDIHWRENNRVKWFVDNESCAEALQMTQGNILLTTGSKELGVYCRTIHEKERLYVRVLPGRESLGICEQNGVAGKQIIAMQGPFSEELNEALIRQFQIAYLVTKESGTTGGFPEKMAAVEQTGIHAFVIGSPLEVDGFSFMETVGKLERLTGRKIIGQKAEPEKEDGFGNSDQSAKNDYTDQNIEIALIGAGMGNGGNLTVEAKQALSRADYVYGAKRLLADIPARQHPKPYYLASEIIPELKRLKNASVAILFSGDTGFYSGCRNMIKELREAGYDNLQVYPGISSVAYLAARCGTSWQDANIVSIHGKGGADHWNAEVIESVRYCEKTFLLVSGVQDLRVLGQLLLDNGLAHCNIQAGYQLSYPGEQVLELTPETCQILSQEGLYVCLIENTSVEKRPVTQGFPDGAFLREKIPMTKEEVREIAISKLHLTEKAVVYDIGSGTGSIAVEIAARSAGIRVYAMERRPPAVRLIAQNCRKHRTGNVQIMEGEAPDILKGLEMPTHVFIGGSGGKLSEILRVLYQSNPNLRIVLTAISLETIGEITSIGRQFPVTDFEIVQLQMSRAKQAGNYHLMQAENPVYIVSFSFVEG